jgi:DNA-binding MarR family transcriptional regulator
MRRVSGTSTRSDVIERIMQTRSGLTHAFAFARSGPLLAANLTMSQLKVLLLLSRPDLTAEAGASGQQITAALGVGLATVTGIVDRLVAHGLVTRREDEADRRVRRVTLTTAGRELVDGILLAGAAHQRRLLERLDDDGLVTVERAFQLLLDAAAADESAAQPGQSPT